MKTQAAVPGGKPLISSILLELDAHLPVLQRLAGPDAESWHLTGDDPEMPSVQELAAAGVVRLDTRTVGERLVHRPIFTPLGSELASNLTAA